MGERTRAGTSSIGVHFALEIPFSPVMLSAAKNLSEQHADASRPPQAVACEEGQAECSCIRQRSFSRALVREREDNMLQSRREWSQIFLLVCSLVGAAIAIYLTAVHYNEAVPLFCSGSGVVNCGLVLSSPYGVVFGTSIPTSVPGL